MPAATIFSSSPKSTPAGDRSGLLARCLCSRTTGVGADGVEFFSWTGKSSGRIHLRNADGSVAEISGNGTRCVAAWMADALTLNLVHRSPSIPMPARGSAGSNARDGQTVDVTTGMGVPRFVRTRSSSQWREIVGVEVSIGNPHFVILVDNADFSVAGKSWNSLGQRSARIAIFRSRPTSNSFAS